MLEWMLLPYRRYFDFSGRSRRKEYWSFQLLSFLVAIVFVVLLIAGGDRSGTSNLETGAGNFSSAASGDITYGPLAFIAGPIYGIWFLVSFIPSIALTVRRLHDRDKSGLYMLLTLIPIVGLIFALIMLFNMFMTGTPGPNRFGADPKEPLPQDIFA